MLRKYKHEGMLLGTAALWGLTFPIMKYVGNDIDSVSFLAIRFSIAALVLLILCNQYLRNIDFKMVAVSVAIGLLYAFHSFLQVEGLRFTSAANSAFITSTNVIFVPVFAFILFGKRPYKRFLWALMIILGGFLLVSNLVTLSPFAVKITRLNVGDLLTLICATLTALYYVLLNLCTKKYNEVAVNLIHMIGAAAGMWLLWLVYPNRQILLTDAYSVGGVLYCGIFGSAIGFLLLSKGQAKLDPAKVAIICSLEAVFAAVFAAMIPGRDGAVEPITMEIFIGGSMILCGVIIISLKQNNPQVMGK